MTEGEKQWSEWTGGPKVVQSHRTEKTGGQRGRWLTLKFFKAARIRKKTSFAGGVPMNLDARSGGHCCRQ